MYSHLIVESQLGVVRLQWGWEEHGICEQTNGVRESEDRHFQSLSLCKEHQPSCWKVPFYYPLVRRSLHVLLKVSNVVFFFSQSVFICLVLEYVHISVSDCIVNCLHFGRVFSLDMKILESSRCWSCGVDFMC